MNQWFEQNPNYHAAAILVGFLLIALLVELTIRRVVLKLVAGTETDLDDEIVRRFRIPLVVSITCVGLHYAVKTSSLSWMPSDILSVLLITGAIMLWIDSVVKVIANFAAQTGTDLDDEIIHRLRRPLGASVLMVGCHYVVDLLAFTILVSRVADAVLVTLGVVLWTDAALKIAKAITERTKTELDDEIVARIRRPLAATVIFIGIRVILGRIGFSGSVIDLSESILTTIALALWAQSGIGVGKAILNALGERVTERSLIQPRTMPLFDIVMKTIVVAGAAYGIFLAWHIDVTAWLASAGVVGIAVGFAAKDTLANLFAGIFIIADAPYKVGDFINLDSGERGKVTDIGIRSTRILTRDDIEITIPNAQLGGAKIVNETGGPHQMRRVRVNIGVGYGSDIDKVREILMDVGRTSKYVDASFEPRVRFRTFGDSALNFQLMAWINKPVLRGRALDMLNTDVYNRLREAGIEIPFPQKDVWLRQQASNEENDD